MRSRREGHLLVLELVGDLNADAAEPFNRRLDEALQTDAGEVLLDLTLLDAVDSSGVGALMRAKAISLRDDEKVRFEGARGQVQRLLKLTGVVPVADLSA